MSADAPHEDVPSWAWGKHTRVELDAMTPEARRVARRIARHGTERDRLADALVKFRRIEWDEQHDVLATRDGGEIRVMRPTYRKRVGPSPLRQALTPKPRVRPRGTYTRELVRATTRGHDHVPERP